MKKALVVLLILAVAGGMFAQEATKTINLTVQSGLAFQKEGDLDPQFRYYSMDAGQGTRVTLDGSYTNADGNAGINFNFRSQIGTVDATGFNSTALSTFVENGYGWLKAMDGMLTWYGGKVDNGTFNPAGAIDTDLDEGLGLMLIASPLPGVLDLGVAGYANTGNYVGLEKNDLMDQNHLKVKVHAAFTVPSLVKVLAGFRSTRWATPASADGTVAASGASAGGYAGYGDQDAYVGVKILALESMGIGNLTLEAFAYNLGEFGDYGELEFGERFEITLGDIGLGARFRQYLLMGGNYDNANDEGNKADPNLGFWVWGTFGLGNIVPRLDVGYVMGTYRDGVDPRRHFVDSMNYKSKWNFEYSVVQIRPSVQFQFSSTSNYIELGYAAFVNLNAPDTVKELSHVGFVDFKVDF